MKLADITRAKEIVEYRWGHVPQTRLGVLIAFNDELWKKWKELHPEVLGVKKTSAIVNVYLRKLPEGQLNEYRRNIEFGINDTIDAILVDSNFPQSLEGGEPEMPLIHEPEYVEMGSPGEETTEDEIERNKKLIRYKRRHGAEAAAKKFGLSRSRVYQIVRDWEDGKYHSGQE